MLNQSSRRALPQVIQRQEIPQSFLLTTIEHVALILGNYEGQARNFGREIAHFDTPEVRQRHFAPPVRFATPLVDLGLDLPHLLVGDHKEVAGAAGRIEDPDPRHSIAQIEQFARIIPRLL
jgi:hypothetical protein